MSAPMYRPGCAVTPPTAQPGRTVLRVAADRLRPGAAGLRAVVVGALLDVVSRRRWIVRNAVLTPTCGNGVWAWSLTRRGAERELAFIRTHGRPSSNQTVVDLPGAGLIVCRASQAGPSTRVLSGAR